MANDAVAANEPLEAPALGEPYLLTPGPLTTAYSVKQAMLRDWGSWDGDFRAMTAALRRQLLAMIGDAAGEFDCVPMQGSGTFAVEGMLASFVPRDGKALVLANGAYGLRAGETLRRVLSELNFRNLDDIPAFAGRNTTTEFLAKFVFDGMLAAISSGELGPGAGAIESLRITLHESHVASASFEGRVPRSS